jgi:O-antigen/teichoic acid export membrane protein
MAAAECNVSLRAVLAIGAPVLVSISLLAGPVLSTLYAPQFTAGANFLAVIVVADALKIPARILGTLIVARGHVATWLIADIGFSLIAPMSVLQAYRHLGPLAAPVGIVFSTLLALVFFWLSARALEGFRMTAQNIATVAVLVLGLVALAVAGPALSPWRLTMAAATVAAVEGLALGRGGLRRLVARG